MARLDWNAVDLDRRFIEVRAGQAKTASRRRHPDFRQPRRLAGSAAPRAR